MSIEQVRTFWDKQPCNVLHSPKPPGTKEYFDEIRARRYFVHPHIKPFVQFEKWRGKKVLEIGCGIGADAISFARAGGDVTAVDLSGESIRLAKRHASGLDIDFHRGNAEYLTDFLPIQEYDLIYAWGILHHTPRPKQVVSELTRYARPDTVLKVMLYYRFSWKVLLIRLGLAQSEAQAGVPISRTYTKRSAADLLEPFMVKEAFVDHIFPYRVSNYHAYQYKKLAYIRPIPRPIWRWLEHRFGRHLCVTAQL